MEATSDSNFSKRASVDISWMPFSSTTTWSISSKDASMMSMNKSAGLRWSHSRTALRFIGLLAAGLLHRRWCSSISIICIDSFRLRDTSPSYSCQQICAFSNLCLVHGLVLTVSLLYVSDAANNSRMIDDDNGDFLFWIILSFEEITKTNENNTHIHIYMHTYIHTYIHSEISK